MSKNIFICGILLLSISAGLSAEEIILPEKKEFSFIEKIGAVALLEGFIAVNSGFAAYYPMPYGIMGTIISPFTFNDSGVSSMEVKVATWSMYLGLCAYNIAAPLQMEMSEKELFWNNFAGWHLIMLGTGIVSLLTDNPHKKKPSSDDQGRPPTWPAMSPKILWPRGSAKGARYSLHTQSVSLFLYL